MKIPELYLGGNACEHRSHKDFNISQRSYWSSRVWERWRICGNAPSIVTFQPKRRRGVLMIKPVDIVYKLAEGCVILNDSICGNGVPKND